MATLRMRGLAFSLSIALLAPAAQAARATEPFAPVQLSVARDSLERARAAAAVQDYAAARNYAKEAEVDARLTWGMTDDAPLQAQAAEVASEARAIGTEAALTSRTPAPAAGSYPSPSAQAQGGAPSPD